RRATDREAAQEAIRGAGRACPRARLDVVAGARRGTARRACVPCRMLAGVAAAVALIHATGVPVARARRARRRLAVGRATGARPGARLGLVAFTGGWPADRPGVPRRVLASVARSVALIRAARVAVVRARRAGGTLRIRRAAGARPGAVLRRVALARGGPADGARVARGVLAGAARAVALVAAARVSVVRAGRARRALCVGRTRGRRPGAALGRVAFARRPATHDEARLEHVGGTGGAGPGAVLVHVAGTGRRAADRAGVPRRVLAGVVRPVALIRAARVAVVGARGPGGLLRVRRTRRTRAGAVLRWITLAAGRAAGGGRRLEGVVGTRAARPG